MLDDKLTDNLQLKVIIEKGKKIVNINLSLSGVKSCFGLLLTIYRATLRSAVEYGSQIFSWNTKSLNFIKLLRIQYKAITKALSYCVSISINAILSEGGELLLHHRFNLAISKYVANKFSTSYEVLRELEYIISQKNRRAEAIKCSKLFKS